MAEAVEMHPHGGSWLREVILGLNDGLVTTLVFVMAIGGLAPDQFLRVALSELLAGGVAMGLGGYLAARTAAQVLAQRIETERREIAEEPDEERAELRAIYRRKGLSGPLLERVVARLSSDREGWLRAMVSDELGVVAEEAQRPWVQGALVGGSFMVGALVPILPFMVSVPGARAWAFGLTAAVALAIGRATARYTVQGPLRNGLELLGVIAVGTVAGVGIGLLLGTA
jgi:VIT1/CCC1 family predicted Fe2+/Mn2+ transporter